MNSVVDKIHGLSIRVALLLKVMYIVMAGIAALGLFGVAVLLFFPTQEKLSFMGAFYLTANTAAVENHTFNVLLALLASMVAHALVIGSVLFLLHKIFKDISRDDTPFNRKHTVRIKWISVMTAALGVTGGLLESLFVLFSMGEMPWPINAFTIIVGIVLYCVAIVFDYGCELQQQSDETL